MEEMLELAFRRINELEKKIERYYKLLNITNELDFILNGTYVIKNDLESIMSGNYLLGDKDGKHWKFKTRIA